MPPATTPLHAAIIMDGNGRWASARKLPRALGHRAGVEAVRRTVRAAGDLGLSHLTLFGFSTENWRRPDDEVSALMDLLRAYVDADLAKLVADGVRVRVIGNRETLAPDVRAIVQRAETASAMNTEFTLIIAFNYGGRDEMVRAAIRASRAGALDPSESAPDEHVFAQFLDAPEIPDPDFIIRTSGEQRISNFLLWQAAYAELIFQDVLWPDFGRSHLEAALAEYHQRERRFGGVGDADQA